MGFIDTGEEDWEENDPKKAKISRVARLNGKNNKSGKPQLLPSGPVSGVFLGGGRIIGPNGSSSINGGNVKLAPDEEDFMRSLINDLESDEKLIEQNQQSIEALAKRKKKQNMHSVALFGAQSNLEDTLNQVYNEDATAVEDYLGNGNNNTDNSTRIEAKLNSMNSMLNVVGAGDYSKPPPAKLQFDDSGDLAINNSIYNPTTNNPTNNKKLYANSNKFYADENNIMDLDSENSPTHTTSTVAGQQRVGLRPLPPTAPQNNNLQDWTTIANKINSQQPRQPLATGVIASFPSSACEKSEPLDEKTGELSLYWYDLHEDPHTPSTLYLFGKCLLPDRQSTASTCVQIPDMQRNIFVLPRKWQLADINDESSVTDIAVDMGQVYGEIKEILSNIGVTAFKCKTVKRNYAFDREISHPQRELPKSSWLDIETGKDLKNNTVSINASIPAECEYLKVVYSFKGKTLPRDLKGKTFSRIFGSKTSALELFLLKREMMGPGWLTISNCVRIQQEQQLSYCKYEYIIQSIKDGDIPQKQVKLMDFSIAPEPPLISVCSVSTKTILNDKTGKHEIAMISMLFHDSINIDGPTMNENQVYSCTLITQLVGQSLPIDLNPAVLALNKDCVKDRIKFQACANERALLGLFIAKLGLLDPDAILSHDLHGFGIELLMNRMKECKVTTWSRIGRLKRSNMPHSTGKIDDSFSLVDRGVGTGRLQVDSLVCAKEFLSGQKTYTLSYLAETQLKIARQEIEPKEVPAFYNNTQDLMRLTKLNESDAFICLSLMFKLMIIPLTKQLTNLCGNLWSRTLRSIRSERVEFLLLHEFHRLKYIIPEKYTAKERKSKENKDNGIENNIEEDNENKEETKVTKKRRGKAQYSGGLVLEPKRGFYDKFVLLLDFNSLYPSIIQEFNICFTTVKHWEVRSKQATQVSVEGNFDIELAELPSDSAPNGRLPKVIARLVERRRQVKGLLKKETDPNKAKQLDIRQKALKLVANSMYGCLGFQSSRFYCEPLAALITSQGREILQRSVELTNSLGANVIYGDTDSIMVYTNESQLDKAIAMGQQIKKEVNKRHKVLEIDIDGIFKNMLLLRKKKYAALKIIEIIDPANPTKTIRQAHREVKGLDLVRRDWCGLSKDIGDYVLTRILSGNPREEVVSAIHSYLEQVKLDLQQNKIPLEKFIITKGMTKSPKDYPDAKSLPHVKVALELIAKQKQVRVGDFIPYIICEGDNSNNIAQRAFHPTTIQQADGMLAVDHKWYLSNQILPPVARLCAPIEETDASRLAVCLGLDGRSFANFGSHAEQAASLDDDELLVNLHENDEEKFKAAKQLNITCPHCKTQYKFTGVYRMPDSNNNNNNNNTNINNTEEKKENMDTNTDVISSTSNILYSGLTCPTVECPGLLPVSSSPNSLQESLAYSRISNQILNEFRSVLSIYYSGWFKCNDSSCGHRTRDISISGRNCLIKKCNGKLEREFSPAQLYLQLAYYQHLFDISRAEENLTQENKRRKELSQSPAYTAINTNNNNNNTSLHQLTPDVPKVHFSLFAKLENFISQLQQKSNYHYLPPSIFATSSSIVSKNNKNNNNNTTNSISNGVTNMSLS